MEKRKFVYDVALSYAGEDREYVEEVAKCLQTRGINVYFDQFEQVKSWGKNLYEHLHEIYSKNAEFCVIFISKAYDRKVWPTHEHRSAQERAIIENKEYILPARFDDTELPGLISTTVYIDLRKITPVEFAELIIKKISPKSSEGALPDPLPGYRVPQSKPKSFNPFDEAIKFMGDVSDEITARSSKLEKFGISITSFEREGKTCIRVVQEGDILYSLNIWMGGLSGRDYGLSFYGISGEIRVGHGASNAWGEMIWDKERNGVLLKLQDMSMLNTFSSSENLLSTNEFIDLIWERIIDEIDRRNLLG